MFADNAVLKMPPNLPPLVVIMGVAGCGKSALGRQLALATGLALIEGDDHHSSGNLLKMQTGTALNDGDRADWLLELGGMLAKHHNSGAVMTCSALRKSYRDQLRVAAPRVRFVWLRIEQALALARVQQRASEHPFPPGLVASQFATLESPLGEPGVLAVDASQSIDALCLAVQSHVQEQCA